MESNQPTIRVYNANLHREKRDKCLNELNNFHLILDYQALMFLKIELDEQITIQDLLEV